MECGGIAVLQNEPRDLGQSQQSNQRTIQEVTEWLRARAESQSNVEKEEDGVQQNVVRIKEEEDDYGYPCSRSNGGWIPTEQSTSSSADINAELQQEEDEGEDEDEMLDMAPSLSSERSLFPSHPARGWLESLAAFPSFNTAAAGPEMAGDNGRLHKCPVCGRGFSRRSSMKRHVLGVHKIDSTGTSSSHHPDSSSTEQTTSSLTANIKTEPMQEEDEDEDEMLDMAPSRSSERSLFPSHPARGWLESLAAFPSFNTAGPEMEVGDNGRLHRCPVCGRGFSRRSSMKRHHEGVHIRPKPPSTTKRQHQGSHKRDSTNTSSLPPVDGAADAATEQTTPSSSKDIKTEPMQEEDETLASALGSETSHSPLDPASGPQESSSSSAIPSCSAGGPDSDADNGRRHKCPICGKGFSRGSTMRRHKEGVHKDGKPWVPPTHTGKRSFDCEQCGKSFQHAQQLVTHERVHTGEKPFICAECGKSFSQSGSLKAHLRTHTGERPFPCPHCEKCFSHAFNLTAHMRTHTGEKPYQCAECGKRFSQLGPLRTHQRSHTGERPYGCQVCGRRFADLGHATRHQRTHRGAAGLLRVREEEDGGLSPGVGEEDDAAGLSPSMVAEEEDAFGSPRVAEEEDGGLSPSVWEEEDAGSARVGEEEDGGLSPRVTEEEDGGSPPGFGEEEDGAGSPRVTEEEESPE